MPKFTTGTGVAKLKGSKRLLATEHMRYLEALGLLADCSVHVPEDLREMIELALTEIDVDHDAISRAPPVAGTLEVGSNGRGEVVINHPELVPDARGVGHIVFSPAQAHNLARILNKQAKLAEREIT
jgi:hypothetical protein